MAEHGFAPDTEMPRHSITKALRAKLYRRDIALARINTHGALTENDAHMIAIAREQMPDLDEDEEKAVRDYFREQTSTDTSPA